MLKTRRNAWPAGAFALWLLAACGDESGAQRATFAPNDVTTDAGGTGTGNTQVIDAGPSPSIVVSADAGSTIKPPIGDRVVIQGALPNGVEGLFTGAMVTSASAPLLVYPATDTMFPPNIAKVLFQWTAAMGNAFHLRFDTGQVVLDLYTDGVNATCTLAGTGGKCWESASDTLMPYLDAASGGKVDFQITALDTSSPATAWQSPMYSVRVAPHRVGGAIYYWSTTVQGVRRGTLDGRDAADYLTPVVAKGQCVACHTLSRSGKRLSIALPGDLLGLADVVATVPPVTFGPSSQGFPGQNIAASWATFSPDESQVVVAGQGVLSLRDSTTAQAIGTPIALPTGTTGSMPDWAPDGKHLVFAASKDATVDRLARHLQGASIAWLSVNGNTFSGLETVAQSRGVVSTACVGQETYANPMFSPDSRWLAFSRGDCESEADASAEVILAAAGPNAAQYKLLRANTQVGGQTLARLQNGMPTWAPSHDPDIGWIAFTSTRDYGVVLTKGSAIGAEQRQLWIAAIDFTQVGKGDPSYPAFRLPAQDLTENNHRPFWTVDVLPPDWMPPIVR
jgi:hypothetical protein